MKLEFLTLNYDNAAPAAGNRLVITLANAVTYQRSLYLKYLEVIQGRVYDNLFVERVISSLEVGVVSSGSGWVTRPQSVTLDPNTGYLGNGYGVTYDPKNSPARVDLGDIYLSAAQNFTVNATLFCPNIVATDRVSILARVALQFEATEDYFKKDFDIYNKRF